MAASIRRCWSAASPATSATGGASYRVGQGKAFVIEGDEYDSAYFDKTAKFLKYLPDIAVVNNIEFDHADIYADLDAVRLAFRRLVNLVPRTRPDADRCRQSGRGGAGAAGAEPRSDLRPVRGRGLAARDITFESQDATAEAVASQVSTFRVLHGGDDLGVFTLPLVGEHNVRNALAALAIGVEMGVSVDRLREGLAAFLGRQAPARAGRRTRAA